MKNWYIFQTVKGSMAVCMEDSALYRLLLPAPHSVKNEVEKQAATNNQGVIIIHDEDHSLEVINKIRSYYQGEIIRDWGVEPDISHLPPFYRRCLEYVYTIPYGTTATYGEVARAVGNPKASRAVGSANSNNPIPLVIPCHRVVAANHLGGFSGSGGLEAKSDMINMEARALSLSNTKHS